MNFSPQTYFVQYILYYELMLWCNNQTFFDGSLLLMSINNRFYSHNLKQGLISHPCLPDMQISFRTSWKECALGQTGHSAVKDDKASRHLPPQGPMTSQDMINHNSWTRESDWHILILYGRSDARKSTTDPLNWLFCCFEQTLQVMISSNQLNKTWLVLVSAPSNKKIINCIIFASDYKRMRKMAQLLICRNDKFNFIRDCKHFITQTSKILMFKMISKKTIHVALL